MAGSEDEWKLLCVVRGYNVYKVVLDSSQKLFNQRWMFFHGMPNILSVRQTLWCLMYRTMSTCCFFFMVYWYRTDLTLVVSSPAGTSIVFVSFFLHAWPLVSSRRFLGLPKGRLAIRLLTFHGSEGSSVILCNNTAEVVCQGRYFAHAQHTDVKLSLQQLRCCLRLTPKSEGGY